MVKNWLLSHVPALEVAARLAYWRVEPLHRLVNRARSRQDRFTGPAHEPQTPIEFSNVLAALRELGVTDGGMLVVHSSFSALKSAGLSPDEVVAQLRDLVGPDGTLAMPAIPIIAGEPKGQDKLRDEPYDREFHYDPYSKRIATGALPKAMMGMPGVSRSLHPGNSMVALGPLSDAMMRDNLADNRPMACGPGSSWHFAYEHDAMIVAIGIDLVHSLTMIHVAEDAFADDWPVPGWYRDRRFRVGKGDAAISLVIRERRHEWAQYYAERAFSRDLYREGVARTRIVDGLEIHACSSQRLVNYLRSHPRTGYPYYFPFGIPDNK